MTMISGPPSSSLSRGRTATHKWTFAAENAAELRQVAVDVTPGLEYDSYTFEGRV
jgi:hypothetical protein